MLFGKSTASKLFRRRMDRLIEGLRDIEVAADYFMVCGCATSHEQTLMDHDANLHKFVKHCEQNYLALNSNRLRLRLKVTSFHWKTLSLHLNRSRWWSKCLHRRCARITSIYEYGPMFDKILLPRAIYNDGSSVRATAKQWGFSLELRSAERFRQNQASHNATSSAVACQCDPSKDCLEAASLQR